MATSPHKYQVVWLRTALILTEFLLSVQANSLTVDCKNVCRKKSSKKSRSLRRNNVRQRIRSNFLRLNQSSWMCAPDSQCFINHFHRFASTSRLRLACHLCKFSLSSCKLLAFLILNKQEHSQRSTSHLFAFLKNSDSPLVLGHSRMPTAFHGPQNVGVCFLIFWILLPNS